VLVLLTPFLGFSILLIGVILAALVAVKVLMYSRGQGYQDKAPQAFPQ
jgi:hypothetical protein